MNYLNILLAVLFSVVSITTGIASMIFSFITKKQVQVEAIKQYYEEGNSEEMLKLIAEFYYYMEKGEFDINEYKTVGKLMGFFDKWATLFVYKTLPIWVFEGNPGYLVITFFDYTKEHILSRRKQKNINATNSGYAINIEKLANKIDKKYNYRNK